MGKTKAQLPQWPKGEGKAMQIDWKLKKLLIARTHCAPYSVYKKNHEIKTTTDHVRIGVALFYIYDIHVFYTVTLVRYTDSLFFFFLRICVELFFISCFSSGKPSLQFPSRNNQALISRPFHRSALPPSLLFLCCLLSQQSSSSSTLLLLLLLSLSLCI